MGLNIDWETVLDNFDFDVSKSKLSSTVSQLLCSTWGSKSLHKPCPKIPIWIFLSKQARIIDLDRETLLLNKCIFVKISPDISRFPYQDIWYYPLSSTIPHLNYLLEASGCIKWAWNLEEWKRNNSGWDHV